MTAFDFLLSLHQVCHFQSKEGKKYGPPSKSELRRWVTQGAFVINGEKVALDEVLDFPITSVILFPKHPITLW
jgi:hypothetical protein